MPWYVVAQIFGVFTIIFEFASYQIEDRRKYFFVNGIGCFFWMWMFVAIGLATGMNTQLSLIVAATYGTIRNFSFYMFRSKDTPERKRAERIFLIIIVAIAVVAGVITVMNAPAQVRWMHLLGAITAIIFVIGQYLPGVHYSRVSVVIYAVAVILTQTPLNILEGNFRWNIMGIMIELAKISSVIIFYMRYNKGKGELNGRQ